MTTIPTAPDTRTVRTKLFSSFKKGFKRAKAKYPEIERIVRENLANQEKIEKSKTDSIDRAADATATMLAEFSSYALQDKSTEFTYNLCYNIGKWIYLIDALDDYDEDKKKARAFAANLKSKIKENRD